MSKSPSSLDIVLPGCADVLAQLGESAAGQIRTLLRLLSRAAKRNAGPVERWLCDRAGLVIEPSRDLPLGPLCRLGDTGRADEKWWLRADLVHKRADRDRLVLLGRESITVEAQWSDRFAQRARPLLEEEGLILDIGSSKRWYIGLEEDPQLRSYDPTEAMGRSLDDYLPTGQGRRRWQRLTTELQMLMHDVTRECPVPRWSECGPNSVWLWGAGVMPSVPSSAWDWICADDSLAKGLGRSKEGHIWSVPASFSEFARDYSYGRGLLVLPELLGASEPLLADRADEILAAFCDKWLEPLAQWLARGAVSRVSVHLGGAVVFDFTPAARWRWWRRGSIRSLLAPPE